MQAEDHYSLLLGIQSPWKITSVDLKMIESRVDVEYKDSNMNALNAVSLIQYTIPEKKELGAI